MQTVPPADRPPPLVFGQHGPRLHFAHANGYPPRAYEPLLEMLAQDCRVLAAPMRPLWSNADPQALTDWRLLAQDLIDGLQARPKGSWIGAGHSMGANATLRAALRQPDLFQALVLIDPVLFPPWMTALQWLIVRLGLAYRLHPLARGALRRRTAFDSRQAMFDNYRRKAVFARLDDSALQHYVAALAAPAPDGKVKLSYPAEWEARIYVTASLADMEIWGSLPNLKPPVLVLRGSETDTFWESTAARFQRRLPGAVIRSLPQAGHLLPLERPQEVARLMVEFIQQADPAAMPVHTEV